MNNKIGLGQNTCISTCASTCEKSIYDANKIKQEQEAGSVIKSPYDQHISLNDAFSAREINLENTMLAKEHNLEETKMFKNFTDLNPTDYLRFVEPHVPEELVSSQCFEEIKNLAGNFPGNLTSFFGFEFRLCNPENLTDYMFAISSKKGEREALAELFNKGDLPEKILKQPEWQQIGKFVAAWADSKSVLHDSVKSLWFEFDTNEELSEAPVPSIFLHTIPLRIDVPKDAQKCKWINRTAIQLLTGRRLSKKAENNLLNCIQKLPGGATLLDVGVMLSRKTSGVRLVINRLFPNQIIPYLKSIGWSDENEGLSSLLKELEQYVSRIVLSIGVGEQIDSKIGIECRFFPDQYNLETGWYDFLDYLTEKGLCIQDKKSAFLSFPGVEQNTAHYDFNFDSFIPLAKLTDNPYSSALVRYISHIKISYKPNHPLEAKGYLGVRLFGIPYGAIKK